MPYLIRVDSVTSRLDQEIYAPIRASLRPPARGVSPGPRGADAGFMERLAGDLAAARLDLARRLLAQSNLPISRIAEECGFSSQSHLTASFRTAHSVAPAQYRTQVRRTAGGSYRKIKDRNEMGISGDR